MVMNVLDFVRFLRTFRSLSGRGSRDVPGWEAERAAV